MTTRKAIVGTGLLAALVALAGPPPARAALDPGYLDKLLAPVALYPDQLLAQMLLCSSNSSKVRELHSWIKANAQLKGSALQEAAAQAGFEPSFVALAPFPQVVELMAGNLQWTSQLGGAFAVDRSAVFDSVQRLRKQGQAAGNLKSTPQQTVESKTTKGGDQVIVIEPANPEVVYVPQYNPQVVYTQPATTTTTVVVHEDDDDEAAVAGALIGFTAGVVIGAAINDNYYHAPYGPYGAYGYRGGAYMYNDGWDDWNDNREDAREDYYDNREDAREDYADHREDMAGERSDRAENAQEQRSDRTGNAQEQRSERQGSRNTPEAQAQRDERRTQAQGKADQARSGATAGQTQATSSSTQARGSGERTRSTTDRSGTRSDAFSGYSSGRSTREASSRGERSRSSSGGRSRRR